MSLILALVVIFFVTQIAGRAAKWIRQPAVIGEILGGILLGPSVLGALSPDTQHWLFPAEILPLIGKIAEIGIVIFMFFVGAEMDIKTLSKSKKAIFGISVASIALPFSLGAILAVLIYKDYSPQEASYTVFTLFLGIAMSITAFPVLARILTDLKMQTSEVGKLALACAAINDAAAWTLLAITIKVTGLPMQQSAHAFLIFAAFLFGAIISNEKLRESPWTHKLMNWDRTFILPLFFAFSGLRTQLLLIQTPSDWAVCLAVVLVAIAGKFGGGFLAARWSGLDSVTSATLGVLMNSRGLVELIVLNIGLSLGLISPRLFAMMVVMALVTTFMASPITIWLNQKRQVVPA